MNQSKWWTKDGLGKWALKDLKKWKKKYQKDIIFQQKKMNEVIHYLNSCYTICEDDPKTAISENFYRLQLADNRSTQEEPYRFFWIENDTLSKELYDYYWENEPIWIVFGNNDYIYSPSALLCCKMIQFRGLNLEDYNSNTENAFWYLENIDSMYRILNEK